ncbi:MAG: hypothetical protein ACLQVL_09695 [Terriglobia bacterium]
MFYRLRFLLVLAAVPAGAQVVIPDTPAGHTFNAWLEAFNSGDHDRMDAYFRTFQPDVSADSQMPIRNMTGGFELLQIPGSERLHFPRPTGKERVLSLT